MSCSNKYHMVRLDYPMLCVVDEEAPGWIIIDQRQHHGLLARLEQGEDVTQTDWADAAVMGNLRTPLLAPARQARQRSLYIELTRSCNLTCSHCYNDSGPGERQSLPLSMVTDLLLLAAELGFTAITLSGGESLLYEGLYDVLDMARTLNLSSSVVTNGTLIDCLHARQLAARGPTITISLDGSCAKINDPVRGDGAFAAAINGCRMLGQMGVQFGISSVVNRTNYDDIPAIAALCTELGSRRLQLIIMSDQGRARSNLDWLGLPLSEMGDLYISLFELQQSWAGLVRIDEEVISTAVAALMMGGEATGFSCSVCDRLRVDAEGNVHPCPSFNHPKYQLGSLGDGRTLRHVLTRSTPICDELRTAQYHRQEHVCRTACPWRKYCGGGCMALAANRTGSVWDVANSCCDGRNKLYRHVVNRLARGRANHARETTSIN